LSRSCALMAKERNASVSSWRCAFRGSAWQRCHGSCSRGCPALTAHRLCCGIKPRLAKRYSWTGRDAREIIECPARRLRKSPNLTERLADGTAVQYCCRVFRQAGNPVAMTRPQRSFAMKRVPATQFPGNSDLTRESATLSCRAPACGCRKPTGGGAPPIRTPAYGLAFVFPTSRGALRLSSAPIADET